MQTRSREIWNGSCMIDLRMIGEKPKKQKLLVLTPEDQMQRAKYRSKWQKIAKSTERINRSRAEKTTKVTKVTPPIVL